MRKIVRLGGMEYRLEPFGIGNHDYLQEKNTVVLVPLKSLKPPKSIVHEGHKYVLASPPSPTGKGKDEV